MSNVPEIITDYYYEIIFAIVSIGIIGYFI